MENVTKSKFKFVKFSSLHNTYRKEEIERMEYNGLTANGR